VVAVWPADISPEALLTRVLGLINRYAYDFDTSISLVSMNGIVSNDFRKSGIL